MNHQDAKRLIERDISELVFLYSVVPTKAKQHEIMERLFSLLMIGRPDQYLPSFNDDYRCETCGLTNAELGASLTPIKQGDNMEYKRLEFKDNKKGQKQLETEINSLAQQGWRVVSSESKQGKYGVAKTTALAVVFLPLALKGRKKGKITVMLERERAS